MTITFERFEQSLQDFLNHLYDPAYACPETVCAIMGLDPRGALRPIQTAMIQAIQGLAPGPEVPPSARERRIYEVLACRYLQKLTQDETAERLSITPRHLRREQVQAVNALAQQLWKQQRGGPGRQLEDTTVQIESPEWLSQVRQELNALESGSRSEATNVSDVIARTVELVSALAAKHGVVLALGQVQPNLVVAIHPSALRQLLVQTLTGMVRLMSEGRVDISAAETGNLVSIAIACSPAVLKEPASGDDDDDVDVAHVLLADHEGTIERRVTESQSTLVLTLPATAKITVLVVDDNADLMHSYRRYVQGTRYHILPLSQGTGLLDMVRSTSPDVIVLDVMLPDIDGWELLAQLHNYPATRSIPVIICSVVREEDLALALGATLYVPKPVRRQEFIQALDQALGQASA